MGEFVPIAFFLLVGFIVWTRHQQRSAEQSPPAGEGEATRYLASQVEVLQDRVEVLERIVTDKGYDVASKIEALRHDHRIDDELADLRRVREGEQTNG